MCACSDYADGPYKSTFGFGFNTVFVCSGSEADHLLRSPRELEARRMTKFLSAVEGNLSASGMLYREPRRCTAHRS